MAPPIQLVGRAAELSRLEGMLDGATDGGAALVLRGEAGIGKSSLLDAARAMAPEHGLRVLYTAGVEAEAGLAYAGLHRLLRPVMGGADTLPARQRDVLLAAFGIGDAEGGDVFLVALAALGLLTVAAAEQPLLLAADDLHWLDSASRDALAFVGRRLEADPIVLLAAVRDGFDAEIGELGLPELVLGGLENDHAGEVLDARAPDLSPAVRRRLLTEAAGNPLALTELPVRPTAAAAGRTADTSVLPISERLERAFARRLEEVPDLTAELLLVASAEAASAVGETLAATAVMTDEPVSVGTLQPAIDAGLVALADGTLRFRHPLVRSAIYQAADLDRRQAAHAALARVLSDQPDRRAWHRAEASLGPDEEVAQEVEDLAQRALRRGAVLQAATAFARAAELSETDGARVRRLLRSAELAFELGRADLVRSLVEDARRHSLTAHDEAKAEWLSEIFHDGTSTRDHQRVLELVEFARRAAGDGEADLALNLLAGAGLRCWWVGAKPAVRERVVDAVKQLPVARTEPRRLLAIAVANPILHATEVMEGVALASQIPALDPAATHQLGEAAHATGDYDASRRLFALTADRLRDQGRLGLLAQVSVMRSVESILVGDWPVASAAANQAAWLAEETSQPIWWAGATTSLSALAGLRGDEAEADALAAQAAKILGNTLNGSILAWVQTARGLTALSAGRYADAYRELVRVFDPRDPAHHIRDQFGAVSYFADAAVNSDRREEARLVIAGLTAFAAGSPAGGIRLPLRYARTVLTPDDEAEAAFHAAIAAPWSSRPFDGARLHLAFGMWLRRHRRVVESREPLRTALSGFDDVYTPTWSERARQELRAAGETSAARRREAWDELSPQELQIAQLAASGLSNREIGQRLFLSHRTVASHLYRLFPKLGITSRNQLAGALRSQ
jgi:DNA-binding CsgD family transcriptional regulator